MKTIVIIGGGSATYMLLTGMRQFPVNKIVIVSTADSGGSTGLLRKELDVMPWGDVRQCLIGLSYTDPALQNLFSYRFDSGNLKGHSAGNIILAALEKITGSPEGAIAEVARLLNARGEILFASKRPTTLSAKLENGTVLVGEHEIDEPVSKKHSPIEKLILSKSEVNPRALSAIGRADAIILGPGDIFTSMLPNLLVPGIAEAITASSAQKILITNIMTKFGQTDGFTASRFLKLVNAYLAPGKKEGPIDTVIVNTKEPQKKILDLYRKEKAIFVKPDIDKLRQENITVIAKSIISNHIVKKINGDALKRSLVRNDSQKIAQIIWDLIK